MKHTMNLKPVPFAQIKAGTKTIELRLNDEKRQRIMPGDTIEFNNAPHSDDVMIADVLARLHYRDFVSLVADFEPASMGYEGEALAALQAGDHGMGAYYSTEDEAQYGALGLKIKVIS